MTLEVPRPSEEPIRVREAQQFLRLESADDKTLIQTIIGAVREQAEKMVGRLLVKREVTLTWRKFFGETDLPFPPVGAVQRVEAYDDGAYSEVPADNYRLRGRRLVVDSFRAETARITYTAGYDRLPKGLKLQMLQDIRVAYDHRDMYGGETLSGGDILTRSAYEQWSTHR
jgi:uncharacterized phiE125 gp8 family phage protein